MKETKINQFIRKNKSLVILSFVLLIGIMGAYAISYTDTGVRDSDGNLVSPRTADVVVCRGTSLADDIIKSLQCDVVCDSTDNDCGDDYNSISSNGTIFIRNGVYPIGTSITLRTNLNMLFENDAIFNNTNSVYQIFRAGDTSVLKSNIKIDGGTFYCQYYGCWYSSGNFSDLTIKNSHFYEGNNSLNASSIQIFFDAYAPYTNVKFQYNIIEGKSDGWDMVGSGQMLNSDFSHNIFRDGNGQGIGVNQVSYSIYSYNIFDNVGNPIGIEGDPNVGNDISYNTVFSSGNIKLGNYQIFTDASSYSTVENNRLFNGGGIEFGQAYGLIISGNIIYNSTRYGIYGNCKGCFIENNQLIDTNLNNIAITVNGTSISEGGIYLLTGNFASLNNKVSNNLIQKIGTGYPGGIATDTEVTGNIFELNSFVDNYDSYRVIKGNYVDDYYYNNTNEIVDQTCTISNIFNGRTIHNSTTSCTCIGGTWKCWIIS